MATLVSRLWTSRLTRLTLLTVLFISLVTRCASPAHLDCVFSWFLNTEGLKKIPEYNYKQLTEHIVCWR